MTDIAVRTSIAELLTIEALAVDIDRVRAQLEYFGPIESFTSGGPIADGAPAHLVETWRSLIAEAHRRGFAF
jgi:hypothetical protein